MAPTLETFSQHLSSMKIYQVSRMRCFILNSMILISMKVESDPGWSPRGNQRWTALFRSFDVFQRWFREHDKHQLWFSLNQRCSELKKSALFQGWTALFQRETALNQRCSAPIFFALKHWIFSAEQRWFSADLIWISSDIYTCRWDHQNMIT